MYRRLGFLLPSLVLLVASGVRAQTSVGVKGNWGRSVVVKQPFGSSVKAFGAIGNGVTDDTAAFQKALDSGASPLFIPKGEFVISDTLRLHGVSGRVIQGSGSRATTLRWRGDDSSPMWLLVDVSHTVLRDFLVRSSPADYLWTGIRSENGSAAAVTPTHLMLENIVIDGTDAGLWIGVQFGLGAGGDNNNDNHHLRSVVVNNYVKAAFSLEHSQAKNILFENCVFAGNGKGQIGVATSLGNNQGGSFVWRNGSGGGNTDTDFRIGDANDNIVIARGNFENSASFLKTSGPSSACFPIEISNTRWESNVSVVAQDPDGYIINYQFAGPIVVRGSTFAVHDDLSPGGLGTGTFRLNTGNAQEYVFEFSNNLLLLAPTGTHPFGSLFPTTCGGNLIIEDKTTSARHMACP